MEVRFWAKVDKTDGCWLWTGFINGDGYGKIARPGKAGGMVSAHRYSFNLANPENAISKGDSDVIMHSCDVPACVNPAHLRRATRRENNCDAIAKGRSRHPRGERNSKAKLTALDVREIRRLHKPGVRGATKALAKKYGISRVHIRYIAIGESWAHTFKKDEEARA